MKARTKILLAAVALLGARGAFAENEPVAEASFPGVELNLRFRRAGGETIVDARGANGKIAWNNADDWAEGGSDEAAAVSVTAQGVALAWDSGVTYMPFGENVALVENAKGEGIADLADAPMARCWKLVRSAGGAAVETVYVDVGYETVTLDGAERPQAGVALAVPDAATTGAVTDAATLRATWYRADYNETPEAGAAVAAGMSYTPSAADYEHWVMAVVTDRVGVVAVSRPLWFSKLPVLYLTTEGAQEPSSAKEDHKGTLFLQGNAEYAAQCGSPEAYAKLAGIHVRGNTTAQEPKKPYKVKLDKKTDLFGMGKNKHWVLLANYQDPGLMRNKVLLDAANRLGCLGMKSVWVEVVMNGEFRGNYQLCEQLRIASGRVDIANWEDYGEAIADAIAATEGLSDAATSELEKQMSEDLSWATSRTVTFRGVTYALNDYDNQAVEDSRDTTGGFLFEIDKYDDEESSFTIQSGKLDMLTKVNMPEFLRTNQEMMDYSQTYLTDFFNAVQGEGGYNAKGQHYTELADIDAMAGYWLAQVVSANLDGQGYSRFVYKDQSGKLVWGPIWDLDKSIGSWAKEWTVNKDASGKITSAVPKDDCSSGWHNGNHYATGPAGNERPLCNFYPLWVDDPLFCLKLREHWQAAREYLLELVADGGTIDKYYDYLFESGEVNYKMWPIQTEGNATFPFAGELGNVRQFKRLLKSRIEWIDGKMASFEGLVASLNKASECKADHPYVNSAAKFNFTVGGTAQTRADSTETEVPDVTVFAGEGFAATVSVDDNAVTEVEVSVNGIVQGTSAVVGGKFEVAVTPAALTAADGRRNLIGFKALRSGSTPLTTFALVTETTAFPTPFDATTVDCVPAVDWTDGFAFTGEGVCPAVTVTEKDGTLLVEGRDYIVTYSDNLYPGTARVVVSGTGGPGVAGDFTGRKNWVGSIEKTFTIRPTDFQTVTAKTALDTREDMPRTPEKYREILRFAYTSDAENWPRGGGEAAEKEIVVTDTINGGEPKALACGEHEGVVRWKPTVASTYRIDLVIGGETVESATMVISEEVINSRSGLVVIIR